MFTLPKLVKAFETCKQLFPRSFIRFSDHFGGAIFVSVEPSPLTSTSFLSRVPDYLRVTNIVFLVRTESYGSSFITYSTDLELG